MWDLRHRAWAALFPVLIAAGQSGCLLTPEVFEERRAFFRDDDGDGFAGEDDCDDSNPQVHPNAVELCDRRDNDCDGTIDDIGADAAWYADTDGDGFGDDSDVVNTCAAPEGFVDTAGDCDDADPSVHPDQPEVCNDRDDDCDGEVDDGAPPGDRVWHPDADADGFGDPSSSYASCGAPGDAWVRDGSDCDDSRSDVHPGADELCDGRDNDCDHVEDEAPTADPLRWYADRDGDGFGRAEGAIDQCLQPASDYVLEPGDCDDTSDTRYPGAPETCNGLDDDCDDIADDPPTTGDGTWYVDLDEDGYGDPTSPENSCEGGPGMVDNGLDCNDSDGTVNPDGTEVCNDGEDNDCDGDPGVCVWPAEVDMEDYYLITGHCEGGEMGRSGAVGDIDGDGQDELLLGAGLDCGLGSGTQGGAIYVFELPITSSMSASSAAFAIYGEDHYAGVGYEFDLADLNADGFQDLVFSEANAVVDSVDGVGRVGVTYGPIVSSTSFSDSADWIVDGLPSAEHQYFGLAMRAIGDVNGDGVSDWASSSWNHSDTLSRQGGAWLLTSEGSGTDDIDSVAHASVIGADDYDYVGSASCGADMNGDGYSDWIVGAGGHEAPGASGTSGAVLILYGPVTGDHTPADADVVFGAENYASYLGDTMANLGDVNSDGYEDIIVGADQAGDGAAYIVWGSTSLSDMAIADADVKFRGDQSVPKFGYLVRPAADLNEDGWDDLLIGEGGRPPNNAYVFYGPFTTATTTTSSSADIALHGDGIDDSDYQLMLGTHDVTGDDVADIIVGSWAQRITSLDGDGVVYIVPGIGF